MKCIIVDDDRFSRKVLKDFTARTELLTLIAECVSAVEAISVLEREQVDLMFLDIKMPEITGMELVRNLSKKPLTIFITSDKSHAIEAFEYDITDYLVKPINYARFYKAIEKAAYVHQNLSADVLGKEDFFIRSGGKLISIKLQEVLFVEALENYVQIHTLNNKHTVHMTMKSIKDKLPQSEFIRVHRSFIVRKDKIEAIIEDELIISTERIPIGRTYKEELIKNIQLL
ncbi:response regulator transcription factor [Candidatus Amoebophilus asiaticus]|nr:response regulator transcription factor [Candidatus Amoebophilus asiaticus]